MQPFFDRDRTVVIKKIPAKLPLVNVDPLQIRRVYENIIANALDTQSFGITFNSSSRTKSLEKRCSALWGSPHCSDTEAQPPKEADRRLRRLEAFASPSEPSQKAMAQSAVQEAVAELQQTRIVGFIVLLAMMEKEYRHNNTLNCLICIPARLVTNNLSVRV